jgi:type I restriction-modification system DNA methylase subunit
MAKKKKGNAARTTTLGFEATLWAAADALRGSMDAAEYKHVVLGLIFLKYISDAFEEQQAKLVAERAKGADPEDPDEYRAQSIFWVPPEARWAHLKAQARQPTIGQLVDLIRGGSVIRPKADISIYSQESNYTTWPLAKINLAIRGIDGQIGHGDTFHNDRHPDLKAGTCLPTICCESGQIGMPRVPLTPP